MAWFPDPPEDGTEQGFDLPPDVTEKDFEAAQEACRQFAQDLVKVAKADAAEVARLQQLAGCMRAHGVSGFPNPSADGSLLLDEAKLGVKTNSSAFKNAEKACAQYKPKS